LRLLFNNANKQITQTTLKQFSFEEVENSWGQMPVRNLPVWSVPTKFFLVDITGHKLNIATATFNILLKLNGVLDHKRPVLVTEFRELG
jgi:hypothetical protein